jgi:hypothetical protein
MDKSFFSALVGNIYFSETKKLEYHPSVASWEEEYDGKTWDDMCGNDEVIKKCNFSLFRRGLFDIERDC